MFGAQIFPKHGKVYALLNVVCACCKECCGPCDVVWNVYTVCVMSLVVCRWVSYAYACCCVPFRYFVLAKLIP